MKLLLPASVLLASIGTNNAENRSPMLKHSGQCVVVITDSWSASRGTIQWFQRQGSQWQAQSRGAPVLVGRAGLAWGRGETKVNRLAGPIKREGDDKAPAGVFRLGTAFGYSRTSIRTKLPYLPLTANIVGIDDSQSRYYNRLVDKTKIADPDWRTAENMVLADDRYKWGIVVFHNVPPVLGAGSCIFLHIWKDSSAPTSGCTAMPEKTVVQLIGWLDPAKTPLLVQLPRSIYNELRLKWGLPSI